jgi:hypothetical protein
MPANEAAAHVNQYATVEGVVAKVFTSKSGNTFLNLGPIYPNQTFTPLGRSKQYWDRSRISEIETTSDRVEYFLEVVSCAQLQS